METTDLKRSGKDLAAYLEGARGASNAGRFKEARESLFNALKLPDLTQEDVSQIFAQQEGVEKLIGQKLRVLTSEIRTRLGLAPDAVTQFDLEAGQAALASLKDLSREILKGEEIPDLEELEGNWQLFRERADALLHLREVHRELDELWQHPYFALSSYDNALSKAKQLALDYPDQPLAQEMLNEAENRRKDARRQEGELVTAEIDGDFKKVIAELERFAREGAAVLPWYDWGSDPSVQKGSRSLLRLAGKDAPPKEALAHLRGLAEQFQEGKADQYLEEAEAALQVHPEAASERVRAAQEEFEYLSPNKREELTRFLEERVGPALERRRRASDLAQAAQRSSETIEVRWAQLAAAEKVDSYASEITRIREQLRPTYEIHLQDELREAEEVRQEGDFEIAAERATAILARIGEYEPLAPLAQEARILGQRCVSDRNLFETVREESLSIQNLASSNLPAAVQALAELMAKIEDRPQRFQHLVLGAGSAVRAQQTLEALLAGWERRLRRLVAPEDDVESLRAALGELGVLETEIDEEIGRRGGAPELLDILGRLDSRRDLLAGRREWKAGLPGRATDAWKRVAKGKGEDARQAREWLASAEDDTAVALALDQAKTCRDAKKFPEALELLGKWRTEASSRTQEVQAYYRDLEREWAADLEAEIQDLVANLDERPLYSVLVDRIDQLDSLRPERAKRYRQGHLVPIYEEWADQNLSSFKYDKAEEYYRLASSLATGAARQRVEGKLHDLRRQQNEVQVEGLWNQGRRAEAREQLKSWLNVQDSNHAPGFARLAELFLEDEETGSAEMYLQQLDRRLEAAERLAEPARAGLRSREEVAEWRVRLGLLRHKTRAITEIREAKGQITEWLSPTSSIREYRRAEAAHGMLIERLGDIRRELTEREPRPAEAAVFLPQEIEERAQQARQEAKRWLDEQLRPAAGLRSWFSASQRRLLSQLREDWKQSDAPELEDLDFRSVSPSAEMLDRWTVGLKIRALFSDSSEGEKAFLEISEVRTRLGRAVRDLVQDPRGPEHGLAQESLDERRALELQLQWGDRLRSWAAVLSELLGNYAWATGKKSEDRSAGETPAQGFSTEMRDIKAQIDEFRQDLFDLTGAVSEAERQLVLAVSAGRDGPVRWEHVPWEDLVAGILRSPKMPPPVLMGHEQPRIYWAALESDDPDVRLDAWRTAVEVLGARGAVSELLAGVSYEIDAALRQSGPEEGWEDVDAALKEHLVRFGQHRVVTWVLRRRDTSRKRRNQLVEARVLLTTLVNAEEFLRAEQQMERMKKLDYEDDYGFRSGEVVSAPEPLDWGHWRDWMGDRKRQLSDLATWNPAGESGTLSRWQDTKRGEFLELMRQARFEEAERLGRDTLAGEEEGRTQQSGGGLALLPLLAYLEAVPPGLEPPLSQRMKQSLAEIERLRRTVKEATGELRFWLEGGGGAGPTELEESIASRRSAVQGQVDQVRAALQRLRFPGKVKRLWWNWRPRSRETQRRYCRQALEELRRLAPEHPELEARGREIEEA